MRPPTPFDCDFESETCSSWNLVSKPELAWTRIEGAVAAQEDAHNPLYDHTSNRAHGYYLLLKPNKTAPFPTVKILNLNSKKRIFFFDIYYRIMLPFNIEVQQ